MRYKQQEIYLICKKKKSISIDDAIKQRMGGYSSLFDIHCSISASAFDNAKDAQELMSDHMLSASENETEFDFFVLPICLHKNNE